MKKTLATLAATASVALLAGAATLITPQKAEANEYNACYYPTAAQQMETMLAGGFTLGEAWHDQVAAGTVIDTVPCWRKTHGYARQYSYSYTRLLRAANNFAANGN